MGYSPFSDTVFLSSVSFGWSFQRELGHVDYYVPFVHSVSHGDSALIQQAYTRRSGVIRAQSESLYSGLVSTSMFLFFPSCCAAQEVEWGGRVIGRLLVQVSSR